MCPLPHYNVFSSSLENVLLRYLLGAMDKCGVNARTAEGRTALSFAVESDPCCLALVKTLLAARNRINNMI